MAATIVQIFDHHVSKLYTPISKKSTWGILFELKKLKRRNCVLIIQNYTHTLKLCPVCGVALEIYYYKLE